MAHRDLRNPMVSAAVRAALTGGTLAASFVAAHAQDSSSNAAPAASQAAATQAQTTPQTPAPQAAPSAPIAEVVVTGTRILNPNASALSPVTTVTSQDFQQMGVTRVEDLLNQLPQIFADQNANASNGASGTSDVNLYGLGAKRTLVLVNGDRLGPGTPLNVDPQENGASDINMIPVELIQNVEILTGGASSVYGADAVAGVVNFKLIDNFQGVRLVGDLGGYQNDNYDIDNVREAVSALGFQQAPSSIWTGAQRSLALISGFNTGDGNGNVTFYATYRNVLSALQNQYSWSSCSLGSGYLPGPLAPPGANGKFSCAGSETAYPANLLNLATGAIATIGPGYTTVPGPSLFNYGPYNYFQRPDERYTAGTFMHYEFNEHATVYEQLMAMDDRSVAQVAPSGDFGTSGPFTCSNPFLEANASAYAFMGCPNASGITNPNVIIARRDVEGGPRITDTEYMDLHEVLGVKGTIDSSSAWTYDGSFQYSVVDMQYLNNDFFSTTKLNNALDVTGTVGSPSCAIGPPCVPYNIFTTGQVTPAMINYLYEPGIEDGRVAQTDLLLTFNGDLGKYGVQLPSASSGLALNLGAEYRDVTLSLLPDEPSQEGDLSGAGGDTPPISGGIISREGFVEALLPLANDKFLAQSANIDVGYRYSSYNLGFNTNTYKISVDWSPTTDVRLRGSFTRAVRAPNIIELYSPDTVSLDPTYSSDPCAGTHPVYTPTQCARTGVIVGGPNNQYGNIIPDSAAQYNGLTGGNANLKPETAITSTIGIELTPSILPNFHANFDYYNIRIEDVINPTGGAVTLYNCGVLDIASSCDLIHRGPGGTLWAVTAGYITDIDVNAGVLQEKGIDVDIGYHYRFDRWGGLVTELQGTYMEHYYFDFGTNPLFEFDCAGLYGSACTGDTGLGTPAPRWRHRWATTWDTPWQAISLTLAWRYYGPVRLESLSPNPNLAAAGGATIANGGISNTDAYLSSYSYFDLTAAIKLADKVTFRLGCNNILDKAPPLIGATDIPGPPWGNGNTFPSFYDALGRFVFAELVADF
jgi:iron complex outermembrane recepter protein